MQRFEIPWRVQIGLIAAGYAAVLAFSATLIVSRYLVELRDPDTFNGGMAAAGDWMLDLFIAGMLLVPTFALAWAARDREPAFTIFAKALFAFSLTAPICLGLSFLPAISQTNNLLGTLCLYRLLAGPMVVLWLASARVFARFKLAKRLLSFALLIELLPIVVFVGTLFFSFRGHGQ